MTYQNVVNCTVIISRFTRIENFYILNTVLILIPLRPVAHIIIYIIKYIEFTKIVSFSYSILKLSATIDR